MEHYWDATATYTFGDVAIFDGEQYTIIYKELVSINDCPVGSGIWTSKTEAIAIIDHLTSVFNLKENNQ